jgi:hypothetical protein
MAKMKYGEKQKSAKRWQLKSFEESNENNQ